MAPFQSSSHMMIDTRFIIEEILIHIKASLHRSVQKYLLFNLFSSHCFNHWSFLTKVLFEWFCRIFAILCTMRNKFSASWDIGHAFIRCCSWFCQEGPDIFEFSSIASIVSGIAFQNVLRRKHLINSSIWINAEPVRKSLTCRECPAGPTLLLIPNRMNTTSKFVSCIKRIRKIYIFHDWGHASNSACHNCTQETL